MSLVSERALAAVMFDMDGLLVDTEPLRTIAEHELAARLSETITPEMKTAVVGMGIRHRRPGAAVDARHICHLRPPAKLAF